MPALDGMRVLDMTQWEAGNLLHAGARVARCRCGEGSRRGAATRAVRLAREAEIPPTSWAGTATSAAS